MGPNDYHDHVMNNAYTQVMASLAIHWGRYMACMCGRDDRAEVPDDWVQVALYLKLPYDNVKRLHFMHEGYEAGAYNARGLRGRCESYEAGTNAEQRIRRQRFFAHINLHQIL